MKDTVVVSSVRYEHVLSSLGAHMVKKVVDSWINKGTQEGNEGPTRNNVSYDTTLKAVATMPTNEVPIPKSFVGLVNNEAKIGEVKIHDILIVAFTADGLSLMATKLGNPIMLDSYMSYMCLQSWGRMDYARALIDIRADQELNEEMVIAIPNVEDDGEVLHSVRVEYEWKPPRCGQGQTSGADNEGFIEVKRKKSGGNNDDTKNFTVLVKPKSQYRPKAKQSFESSSPKTTPFVDTNKASISGYNKESPSNKGNMFSFSNSFEALNDEILIIKEVASGSMATTSGTQEEGQSATHIADTINVLKKQILEGKLVLVDDDGKPLEKVDYPGDLGRVYFG
ncbi:hypothetical protein Tco_0709788 [Tanacetum coccineum]